MTSTPFTIKNGATITGTVTATAFSGDGSALTGISAGLSNVVEDTTPQLGGNLDTNGNNITNTGSLLIDVSGTIQLDADDSGEVRLLDGGTQYATIKSDSSRLKIQGIISDQDILIVGNDGGVETTAMAFDMSEGGNAVFYAKVGINSTVPQKMLEVVGNSSYNNPVIYMEASNSSGYVNNVLDVRCGRTTTNGSYNLIQAQNGDASGKFIVQDGGACRNTSNSYGGISDVKLKENIADASSQWNDIKNLQIRKYSLKQENSVTATQLGVIAQELESAGMNGLVDEIADRDDDGNDLGTTTKSVKYSVLYMKAVKALQEAITKIEDLEARVDALESPDSSSV